MRVLFLTRYPIESASSRYRVHQYLPYLDALGVDCAVQSFMDRRMYELSVSRGQLLAKVISATDATLRRLGVLIRFRTYDIIYIQRELFPAGPPLVERLMKRGGARLILDYDDTSSLTKAGDDEPLASAKKIRALFRLSDCVVTENNWMRDRTLAHCRRAVTVEAAEDVGRYRPRPPSTHAKPVTVGWLGAKSTARHLQWIEPALRAVSIRFPAIRFEIVGGSGADLRGLQVTHTQWSYEGEVDALARFDIGLMPLPLEDSMKGESARRARLYMAAGLPTICTRNGDNAKLIRQGETGFLCESLEDWEAALARLAANPNLRDRIGQAARRDVAKRFSPERQAQKLYDVLQTVAGHSS